MTKVILHLNNILVCCGIRKMLFFFYSIQAFALCLLATIVTVSVNAQNANFSWAKSGGSSGGDQGLGVATDADGNVFVTGFFSQRDADFNPGGGSGAVTSAGGNEVYLVKYDNRGNFLWAKSMGGNSVDEAYGVAADGKGNVYITGRFNSDTADFNRDGSNGKLTSAGNHDVFLVKYDAGGNYLWAKNMGGNGAEWGYAVTVDGNDNVYITGAVSATGGNFNPGGSNGTITSAGSSDVYLAKYDSSGNYLWAKSMGGTGLDQGRGIAADVSGNVYVTGRFNSATANFNPDGNDGTLTRTGSSGYDIFLAKYDANGGYLWAKAMGGTGADHGYALAVDGTGNVFVTGSFTAASGGTNFNPDGSGGTLTAVGALDAFVAKYDTGGHYLWAKNLGGIGNDEGWGIAVDGNDNVYVTGHLASAGGNFNPGGSGGTLTSAGNNDVFVAKYDAGGNYLWAKSLGGTGAESGLAMAVDDNDNVHVTGFISATGADFNPGGNGGVLTSAGGQDMFVLQLNQRCEVFTSFTQLACDSFAFNGITYTSTGTYVDTFISFESCDSIVTFNLTILDTVWHSITVSSCDSYSFNGQVYTQTGAYNHSFTSALGCDSIATLNLTIDPSYELLVEGHYCDSVTFNGVTYTSTGIYTQQYPNVQGCDSNIVYDITIGQTNGNSVIHIACDSFVFNDTLIYTASEIYTITLTNQTGCDSIVVLDVTIDHSPVATISKQGNTLTTSGIGIYQWLNCDNGLSAVPGATEPTFTPEQTGNYAVAVTHNECSDTSECVAVDVQDNSISELGAGNEIQLYPNPTDSRVIIQAQQPLKNVTFRLISTLGQVLQQRTAQYGTVFTLDMSRYAGGIYFVEINEGKKVMRMKIVKN